ncbi:HIRAN domain-containing protein [Caldifermentibacillus hisashii]|uniref:HIRAN domain-containing protein n=1 Tax=Caldifermentibacillus hisashii TaxID=996558 RepID=UPI0034D6D7AF
MVNQLKEGIYVNFELNPTNERDSKAVIVLSDVQGHKLGYIPAFYSGFMFDVIRK